MSGTAPEPGSGAEGIPIAAPDVPMVVEGCRSAAAEALERAQQAAANAADSIEVKQSLEAAIEAIDGALAAPDMAAPEQLCHIADELETALDVLETGGSPDLHPVIEKARAAVQE
jgi:hypothetical protein